MYKELGVHVLAEEQAQAAADRYEERAPAAGSPSAEHRDDASHYEMFRF